MPDDRLQLPDTLEQALEYAKQQPTDWELAKQRALIWEQVSARGRRMNRWARWWKPLVGVVAGVAVVLAAVLVPSHLTGEKEVNNWSTASSPASQNQTKTTQPLQPLHNDDASYTKMYEQQGLQFIWHDQASGYDLVMTMHGANNSHELEVARNGDVHPILAVPDDKKVQPIGYATTPLIGFHIVNSANRFDSESIVNQMYFVNTDTMKVNSMPIDAGKGFISQVGVWDRRPNQLSVIYSQIDTKTANEQVSSWDWTEQGSGETRTLLTTNNEFLKYIQAFGPHVVLGYQHHLFTLTEDGGVQKIDADPKLDMQAMGIGTEVNGADGVLYLVGTFPDPQFGSYSGNRVAKWYSFATGKSLVLLPGVRGDQALLGIDGNQMLLQNFVADDAMTATKQPLSKVPGTLQLWYVKGGSSPKLVYQKHRVGETYMAVFYGDGPEHQVNQLLLTENPTDKNAPPTLLYDWQTQTVTQVAQALPAKPATK